jgi:hypothetical protein
MDVFLPLLAAPHAQTSICIAQLLGTAVRRKEYRQAVAEWMPPAERTKDVRPRRGWEKRDSSASGARQGGWAARTLTVLMQRKDMKVRWVLWHGRLVDA